MVVKILSDSFPILFRLNPSGDDKLTCLRVLWPIKDFRICPPLLLDMFADMTERSSIGKKGISSLNLIVPSSPKGFLSRFRVFSLPKVRKYLDISLIEFTPRSHSGAINISYDTLFWSRAKNICFCRWFGCILRSFVFALYNFIKKESGVSIS